MPTKKVKTIVVMPAYNAAKTLKRTYDALPKSQIDQIILVDDASKDETVSIAKELGLKTFVHKRNLGYGANQKTCYLEALKEKPDVVVMLHPDYQYDPKLLPRLVEPIARGDADVVLGSRLLIDEALKRGMPWWKYISNRILTMFENIVLRQNLSEYHTGYRAYSGRVLESLPFTFYSDGFIFDQEMIFQAVNKEFVIKEIYVPARYFPEASSIDFRNSTVYGLLTLLLTLQYIAHRSGYLKIRKFARELEKNIAAKIPERIVQQDGS